mgnify:CR=1 FL=1
MFNCKGKAQLREQWDQLWLAFDKLGFLSEIGWIAVDGDTGTVGISDFAQGQLGDITYVDLPRVGASFAAGAVVSWASRGWMMPLPVGASGTSCRMDAGRVTWPGIDITVLASSFSCASSTVTASTSGLMTTATGPSVGRTTGLGRPTWRIAVGSSSNTSPRSTSSPVRSSAVGVRRAQ